jgi:hypothetical protein
MLTDPVVKRPALTWMAVLLCSVAGHAYAQSFDSIRSPEAQADDAAILTTREAPVQPAPVIAPLPAGLPWHAAEPEPKAAASPVFMEAPAPAVPSAPASYKPKIPFGRGEAAHNGPEIPSGPRSTIAVPVVGVEELEAAQPQPTLPIAPEADPAQEDPAEPTELTSPIFEADKGDGGPQRIILRALNKVTAQSELIEAKPEEKFMFGQLEITAINCRTSSPTSQTDYAALLEIAEQLPGKKEIKPLFRGWMYASSPSIAALEHPVYDVTMVRCKELPMAAKAASEPAKKAKN